MVSPSLVGYIEKAVFYQRCSQYVNVASLVFLLLDYLETLPAEVSLVWPRQWSAVKVLFLISRYLPFIHAPLTLYVGLQSGASLNKCASTFGASSILIVVSMVLAEAVMFIRLYALSEHSKKMFVWLALQFTTTQVTVFAIFSLFVKSVKFIASPLPNISGCIPYRFDSQKLLIVFGLIVASQLAIVTMSSWIGLRKYRRSGSSILLVFYRDGLFYFISLTAVTVGNIIFDRTAPRELRFMLTLPQGILHSVLSCRLILHIYDFARRELNPASHEIVTGTGLDFAVAESKDEGSQMTKTSRIDAVEVVPPA